VQYLHNYEKVEHGMMTPNFWPLWPKMQNVELNVEWNVEWMWNGCKRCNQPTI